jgi:hypothetical protein
MYDGLTGGECFLDILDVRACVRPGETFKKGGIALLPETRPEIRILRQLAQGGGKLDG